MITDIHTHSANTHAQTIEIVGIHPWHAADCNLSEVEVAVAKNDAIGEIGLDFACDVPRDIQESVFRAQLALAERYGKPVILHCVRAFEQTTKIVGEYHLKAVIFHGFIGSKEQVQRAVQQGYYLSFGERTLRSPKSIEALRYTPLSHLFVESDESNTPIEKIYEEIAALRGIAYEDLIEVVNRNFQSIFKSSL